jgi:hypothetical protein
MTHESSSSQMHTFWHDHECACCIDTDCIACCIDTDCIACCIDTDCIACCMAMHAMFERACMHAPCSSFPKVTKVSAAPFVAQAHTTIAITHVAIMCAPHRLSINVLCPDSTSVGLMFTSLIEPRYVPGIHGCSFACSRAAIAAANMHGQTMHVQQSSCHHAVNTLFITS